MDKLEILINMINESPENTNIWHLLALEYHEQGMLSESLGAYSKALQYADENQKLKISNELADLARSMNTCFSNESEVPNDEDEDDDDDDKDDNESDDEINDFESKDERQPIRLVKGPVVISHTDSIAQNVISIQKRNKIAFQDVGGLDTLKESIRMKIIKPFTNPGLFARFNKKIGGGILLYGPPGCGKTFIAKATAGECNAYFIPIHISDILSKYVGESEQNIRAIFDEARRNKPAILFMDEIDTIGYNRSRLSSEHMRSTIDQLLTEIEGIDSNTSQMLIIGATNMPWDVDAAFKRPGRFDKAIFVPPPDYNARVAILDLKLSDKPCDQIDLDAIASKTEFYSGADLENLIEIASELVITEIMKTGNERNIKMDDIEKALSSTRPSTLEWLRTIKNYVAYSNQTGAYDDVAEYLRIHKKSL